MTLQLAGQAVLDKPGRAVGTIEAMAAGAAERQRGIASAIEKQQGLLARRQRLFQGADEAWRKPTLARQPIAAQIDGRDLGEGSAGMAIRQMQGGIAARGDVLQG